MKDLRENSQQEQSKEQTFLDKIKYYSNLTFVVVKPYVYPAISIIGVIPWTFVAFIVGIIATIGAIFLQFNKQNSDEKTKAIKKYENTSGQWPSLVSPTFYVKLANFLINLVVVQFVWRIGKLALGIPQDVKMGTSLFWVIHSIPAHIKPNDKTFLFGCGFLVLIFIKVVFMLLAMAGLMPTSSPEVITPVDPRGLEFGCDAANAAACD